MDRRNKWWFCVLMAFVYFPIRIKGFTFLTYIVVYVIPIMYLVFNIRWLRSILNRIRYSRIGYTVIILCVLLLVSVIYPVVHGTFDFSYIFLYWRYFFLILLKSVFLAAVYEKNISKTDTVGYVECFLYALCLYVVFTAITLLVPPLRNWLVSHLYMTPKEYTDSLDPVYVTRFGWSGFAGFGMTIYCSIGVILACGMVLRSLGINKQIKYLCLMGVLLIGNMFYGRSGMLVSLFCIFFTFLKLYIKKAKKAILIIIASACTIVGMIVVLKDHNPQIQTWYRWCFSLMVSFLETGKATDGSLRTLTSQMYWLPSIKTILFGDGYYTMNGRYYMHTDSGIMRPILYYGLPFYLLGICGVLNCYSCLKHEFVKRHFLSSKDAAFFVMLLFFSTCLFEFKGEAYYLFICVLLPIILIDTPHNANLGLIAKG